MDKKKILNLVLVILPLAAVVLAGMPDCVTVLRKDAAAVSCSMFTLIEDVQWSFCLPFAGIVGALTFGLGVLNLVKQKDLWVRIILGTAFVSMTLSVVQLLTGQDVLLIPNMLIPILLGVETLLAYSMIPKPVQEEQKQNGNRLKPRK
jgi:hypothetical protein